MTTAVDATLARVAFLRRDADSDAVLAGLVGGILAVFDRCYLIGHGAPGCDGSRTTTDPSVAPAWALDHAALYTGGTVPARHPGEPEDAHLARARVEITSPTGMRAGSRGAAIAAATMWLTGTRTLIFRETWQGSIWRVMLVTRPAETPDPAAVRAAVEATLPAGVRLIHEVRDEADWQQILDTYGAWSAVKAQNTTWTEVTNG